MNADPGDTAIVGEVSPADGDRRIVKRRYSAFAKTDLAEQLAAAGRDQLIITGVYAHIGVTATAFDAFQREIRPFVPADAVAAFTADQHARALDIVADSCGVVSMSDHVIDELSSGDQPSDDWEASVTAALAAVLSPDALTAALADPEVDLFAVGLTSLKAFTVLDELVDAGVDIDFGELVRRPTLAFLRDQGRTALVR